MGNPERLVDWTHRVLHETTIVAKRLIEAFYGQTPAFIPPGKYAAINRAVLDACDAEDKGNGDTNDAGNFRCGTPTW